VNEFYEIHIDRAKNRCYITFKGYWKSIDEVPDIVKDLTTFPKLLMPNFTTLTDIREFKTPAPTVMEAFIEAQKENSKHAYRKAARVVTQPLEKMAVERVWKGGGFEGQSALFNTIEEAEAWLDE
ncbi:MAG: hypothetical protein JW885_00695, partial [Deltaproteobacteria bacterium]|nr:hypothetical protein [Candidatus Zymogenaceae bacterium]